MASKERVQCVDIAKGLAIIAVAMVHIIQDSAVSAGLNRWIGGFLGMFFILSSYFYTPGKGYRFNVQKRIFQIVIPLLVYNLVVLVLCYVFETCTGSAAEPLDYVKAYWDRIYDNTSLTAVSLTADTSADMTGLLVGDSIVNIVLRPSWFLNRLFFTELIFFAVADWALESFRRVCGVIFGLLTVTVLYVQFFPVHLPEQFDSCFAIAAIMLFGSYMKEIGCAVFIEKGPWDRKKVIISAAFLACFVLAGLWFSDFYGCELMTGKFGTAGSLSVYLWFVCQVIFFYVILLFSSSLSHVPYVSSGLKLIGKHTLIILIFHMLFGKMALYGIWKIVGWQADSIPLWANIVAGVISIAVSLAVSLARDKIKAKHA